MDRNEFNELAQKVFGERVSVRPIPLNTINAFLTQHTPDKNQDPITQEELDEYGSWAWAHNRLCVVCEEPLKWSFKWGFVKGDGACSYCKGASYRLYHRVRENGYPFMGYALIGWNDAIVERHGLDPHRKTPA